MTYGDLKKHVLKLMDEYSSRGVVLTEAKTADTLLKVQHLVNDVQYELASTVAKIPGLLTITRASADDPTEYALPADWLKKDYLMVKYSDETEWSPFLGYYISPDGKLRVRASVYPAEIAVYYWKRPRELVFTGNPAVDDVQTLDIPDDAQRIMAYGIAGQVLVSTGETAKGTLLLNQYEAKKAQLVPRYADYPEAVIDALGWWLS